jgi:hypothetical protein
MHGIHVLASDTFDRVSFLRASALKESAVKWKTKLASPPSMTHRVMAMFRDNLFGSDTSMLCQALDHMQLWREIASTRDEMHLVIDGDASQMVEGWAAKWNTEYYPDMPHNTYAIYIQLNTPNVSMFVMFSSKFIYLGGVLEESLSHYQMNVRAVNSHFLQHVPWVLGENHDSMDQGPATQPRRRFPYLAIAYVMSSHAARVLVELVEAKGFVVPAHVVLMKVLDLSKGCYTAAPFIAQISQQRLDPSLIKSPAPTTPSSPQPTISSGIDSESSQISNTNLIDPSYSPGLLCFQ